MKIGTYYQLRILCIVSLAASCGLTGCKGVGSWKMPKMSWSREPSATTLAGNDTPKLPESPANKYSPSAIASVGAGTASAGSFSGNKAATYGNAGQAPSTTSPGSSGLAASANGYQTGPYTTGPKSGATFGSQSVANTASPVAAGLPNPYGGSYAGMTAPKNPDAALSNSAKSSLSSFAAPTAPNGYGVQPPPAGGSAYASNPANLPPLPPTNNQFTATSGLPVPGTSVPGLPPQGLPSHSLPASGHPTVGHPVAGLPATSNPAYPPNPYQSLPPSQSPVGTLPGQVATNSYTYPGTTSPSPAATRNPAPTYSESAQPANRYSGVYQPGTTARPTTYNFGTVAPAAATGGSAAAALPPNTASGTGPGLPNPSAPVMR